MRAHGFTVLGPSILDVVLKAVYRHESARIQTTALITRAAHFGLGGALSATEHGQREGEAGLQYLNEKEAEDSGRMISWAGVRPWRLWLRDVEASGLYVNAVITTTGISDRN